MKFKLGLCQMSGTESKDKNIEKACEMIYKAADMGAEVVSLPEMFNCPYDNKYFRKYAENENGKTVQKLSDIASDLGIYIVGGSIPEIDDDKVYNTCFCFDKKGDVIAKHRKIHLFNINIDGGIRFMESDTLTSGNEITLMDTEFCKIGIGICFDVRFPEMFRNMTLAGAELVVLPAAFNMTTGPAHWDLAMRSRAVDNQIYFAACSPARNRKSGYVAYGHSCIVNPWGDFTGMLDENEDILVGTIDTDYVRYIREQLPILSQRREDVY